MNTQILVEPETRALACSAIYGVLAGAFRRPGTPHFRGMADPQEAEALYEAALVCSEAPDLLEAAGDWRARAQDTGLAAIEVDYRHLFGNTSRGLAPPYESEYGGGGPFFQPQLLSDIAGFYRAFGLQADPEQHERCDHFCCECEFLCFLHAKEAHALAAGNQDMAETAACAQRLFLRDHLGQFSRSFLHRVMQHAPDSWHAAAAAFAKAFIESECRRFGVEVNRAYLPLRSADDFDVPMACGGCSLPCGEAGPDAEAPE
jgi:TorA maturation chaperone TorD